MHTATHMHTFTFTYVHSSMYTPCYLYLVFKLCCTLVASAYIVLPFWNFYLSLLLIAYFRYSTAPKTKREMQSTTDILRFIRSSLYKFKGPFHCWLNMNAGNSNLFSKDGIFLVLIDEYLNSSLEAMQNSVKMFENAKSLKQRYPFLQVLVLQYGKSILLNNVNVNLIQRIIQEYVTFPVLLSIKAFEMPTVPCQIISKGFQNPRVYSAVDTDLVALDKALQDLSVEHAKGDIVDVAKSTWAKPVEVVKESDICLAPQNLLFSFPGCISIEESGNRIFLSDINHHRIVVFDGNGKIVDAIGSSPGFEDGEFEIAKLMRPAASFHHAYEDCLYFVDSENHAIRRADMRRRIVDTVFPVADKKSSTGLWKWILDKIWIKRNVESISNEHNSDALLFPWHLLKSSSNELYVLNKSLDTLWIVDQKLGQIREVVKGSPKILEICGQMIQEKCIPLAQFPSAWLQQRVKSYCSLEGIPYAGLMSSVATCQNHVIICDTVCQTVVKFSEESGSTSNLQFSNFGILGHPYWLRSSLERVYSHDGVSGVDIDHSECFRLLPGRIDIELNIDIPKGTDLVEPIEEGCIWRQARGAAVEVSGVDNKAASSEIVGVAQQWYDEIDNLGSSMLEEEPKLEEKEKEEVEDLQEGRVRIGCTINTSPGTSELIVSAALYLRLQKKLNSGETARIADMLDPKGKLNKDVVGKVAMTMSEDGDAVFMRPVHVRLKFETGAHPSEGESLTHSSVKVHVALY